MTTPAPQHESHDDAFDPAADDAPPAELDLSDKPLFDNETATAPKTENSLEPAPIPVATKPPGPIFRASLIDALWLVWRKASGNPVTEIGCRSCGYPARHLTKLSCPECGADFMSLGLIDPRDSRIGLIALALGWTIAVAVIAFSTRAVVAQQFFPAQIQRFVSLDFVDRNPADPHRLTLFGENSVRQWPRDSAALDDSISRMVVYLADKESAPVACDLDLANWSYSFRAGGKPLFSGFPSKGRLDEDAIATWILFSGIEAKRDEVAEHGHMAMATLAVLKQRSSVARQYSPDGYGVYDFGPIRQVYAERSSRRIDPQFAPLLVVGWCAIWFLGIAAMALVTRNRIVN